MDWICEKLICTERPSILVFGQYSYSLVIKPMTSTSSPSWDPIFVTYRIYSTYVLLFRAYITLNTPKNCEQEAAFKSKNKLSRKLSAKGASILSAQHAELETIGEQKDKTRQLYYICMIH